MEILLKTSVFRACPLVASGVEKFQIYGVCDMIPQLMMSGCLIEYSQMQGIEIKWKCYGRLGV